MTKSFKTLGLAAVLSVTSALAANAALIDFTDGSLVPAGDTLTGTESGGWTLVGVPGPLNNAEAGPGGIDPLVGETDGIGIGETDDEVTAVRESLTITFDKPVIITGLYFLDLFVAGDDSSKEIVEVSGDATASFEGVANNNVDTVGFFGEVGLSLDGTTFTFTPAETNDSFGRPDFALAGIEVELAPIPLPAGILLLGGALAGLGVARRRS